MICYVYLRHNIKGDGLFSIGAKIVADSAQLLKEYFRSHNIRK